MARRRHPLEVYARAKPFESREATESWRLASDGERTDETIPEDATPSFARRLAGRLEELGLGGRKAGLLVGASLMVGLIVVSGTVRLYTGSFWPGSWFGSAQTSAPNPWPDRLSDDASLGGETLGGGEASASAKTFGILAASDHLPADEASRTVALERWDDARLRLEEALDARFPDHETLVDLTYVDDDNETVGIVLSRWSDQEDEDMRETLEWVRQHELGLPTEPNQPTVSTTNAVVVVF